MAKEGSEAKQTALSLGATSLTAGAAGTAFNLLNRALKKTEGPKEVQGDVIDRLSKIMGFRKDRPFIVAGKEPSFEGLPGERQFGKRWKTPGPRGWIELPGLDPRDPRGPKGMPLGPAAHEMGHAKGLFQRVTGALSRILFTTPEEASVKVPKGGIKGALKSIKKGQRPKFQPKPLGFMLPAFSPLHVPLLAAAVMPKAEKGPVRWIQEHPAEIAAGMAAIPLSQEAHASAKGLAAIKKLPKARGGGWAGVRREAGPLARGLGTHALSHLPAIAAILAGSKVRDLIQKRREGKIEKTASFNSTLGGDLMNIEESFLGAFGDTLDKIAQGEEEEEKKTPPQFLAKKKKEGEEEGKEKKKEGKEDEEGQKKEGSLLSNFRESLGISKTASKVSSLRAKLGLEKTAATEEAGKGEEEEGQPTSAFEAWKSTL